jgi:hypothetical protein
MFRKLVEFLDLHQGYRSVYEYIQEFNNLAQYGSHHVDTDVKKADLFHKGLTIQLQDRLILSQNLSYNELASVAIDQEGTMKACEVAEEKRRKRVPHGLHPTRGTAAPPSATVLGQSPIAAAVQPCSTSTAAAAAGGSQATTVVYACRLPMLQLREN